MSTQHTPGPWVVSSPNSTISLQIRGSNLIVAAVPKLFSEPWAEANAKLIAAAPDLLEALQLLVSWADELHRQDPSEDLRKARAAIRKATGGAA